MREKQHRRDSKVRASKLYKKIRECCGFDMELLYEYECANETELRMEERRCYDKLKPTLNMNRPYINDDELKQLNKQYREQNIDTIREREKQYNIDNQEHIREQKKQYHEANIHTIRERQKQYRINNREMINQKARERRKLMKCN